VQNYYYIGSKPRPRYERERARKAPRTLRRPMTQAAMKVVFLDRDTISPETTLRSFAFPHTLTVHARSRPEEVAERIADADIVIVNKVPIRADALAAAPRLRMI